MTRQSLAGTCLTVQFPFVYSEIDSSVSIDMGQKIMLGLPT